MAAYTAVVTGASRGLGLGYVKKLLSDGARVFAGARTPGTAKALQELQAKHEDLLTIVELDVADEKSITAAAQTVAAAVPHIDLLINNAGIAGNLADTVLTVTKQDLARLYETNVIGVLLVTQAFFPLLVANPNPKFAGGKPVVASISSSLGSVIRNGSEAHHFPVTAYRLSKSALNNLNRCFAAEHKNIIFVAIEPGWVDTDMGSAGGLKPPLTVEQSTESVYKSLRALTAEKSGAYVDINGEVLPF